MASKIVPTEPGWYLWKSCSRGVKNDWVVVRLSLAGSDSALGVLHNGCFEPLSLEHHLTHGFFSQKLDLAEIAERYARED